MSRYQKACIIALCLFVTAVFIWLDHSPLKRKSFGLAESKEQTTSSDFEKYHEKTFTVVKVVDGDTIDIDIPDVDKNYTRIRLWGIDTPETKSRDNIVRYFGPEAAKFTTESALGKKVTVYLEEHRTRDKYGRLLAYVQLPDGRFLNEVLVSEGFAYADLRFRHSLYHKYERLEAGARRHKKGLWKNVTQEQLPEWLQRMNSNLPQTE
jgi:micrococcal nuclease